MHDSNVDYLHTLVKQQALAIHADIASTSNFLAGLLISLTGVSDDGYLFDNGYGCNKNMSECALHEAGFVRAKKYLQMKQDLE